VSRGAPQPVAVEDPLSWIHRSRVNENNVGPVSVLRTEWFERGPTRTTPRHAHLQPPGPTDEHRQAGPFSRVVQYVFSTLAATLFIPRKTPMLDMICIMEPSIW